MTSKKQVENLLFKQVKFSVDLPMWVVEEILSGLRFRASFHEKSHRENQAKQLRAYARQLEEKIK